MEDLFFLFALLAVIPLLGLYFGKLCKWHSVKPTQVMILQGFGDINRVKKPGNYRIQHPWQTAQFLHTVQISVDVEKIVQEAWLFDQNTGDYLPIDMEASEISIDLRVPQHITPENAQAYVNAQSALFERTEPVVDETGNIINFKARAGQFLRDDVTAIVRKRWADKRRHYDVLKTDKGALAKFILTCLRGMHQSGCPEERYEYLRATYHEMLLQLEYEAKAEARVLAIKGELDMSDVNMFKQAVHQLTAEIENELSYLMEMKQLTVEIEDEIRREFEEKKRELAIQLGVEQWVQIQERYERAEEQLYNLTFGKYVDQDDYGTYNLGSDNWGVEIIGVTVNQIKEADVETAKAAQMPAQVTFQQKARVAQAHADVEVAKQQVRVAEQQGLAYAALLEKRADAIAEELGLEDDAAATWLQRQEAIDAIREGWSQGGGAVLGIDSLLNRLGKGGSS